MSVDIVTLNQKHFLTDLRAQLYLIAIKLTEEPNYREHAIRDIDAVCGILSDCTPTQEVTIYESDHN